MQTGVSSAREIGIITLVAMLKTGELGDCLQKLWKIETKLKHPEAGPTILSTSRFS